MTKEDMDELAADVVDYAIPVVELIGAAVIVFGVLIAFGAYVLSEARVRPRPYEEIRLILGRFLALGLEFQLAADILGTAVTPTFDQIGKLAAVAAIRTILNFFLAKEIEKAQHVIGTDDHHARQAGLNRSAPAPE